MANYDDHTAKVDEGNGRKLFEHMVLRSVAAVAVLVLLDGHVLAEKDKKKHGTSRDTASVSNPTTWHKDADVAVAMTGSYKTILAPPVVSSFSRRCRAPLAAQGHQVAMFAALTGNRASEKQTVADAVAARYRLVLKKVEFVPSYTATTACVVESKAQGVGKRSIMKSATKLRQVVSKVRLHLYCQQSSARQAGHVVCKSVCSLRRVSARQTEAKNVLTHWAAIRQAYASIEAFEKVPGLVHASDRSACTHPEGSCKESSQPVLSYANDGARTLRCRIAGRSSRGSCAFDQISSS